MTDTLRWENAVNGDLAREVFRLVEPLSFNGAHKYSIHPEQIAPIFPRVYLKPFTTYLEEYMVVNTSRFPHAESRVRAPDDESRLSCYFEAKRAEWGGGTMQPDPIWVKITVRVFPYNSRSKEPVFIISRLFNVKTNATASKNTFDLIEEFPQQTPASRRGFLHLGFRQGA